jgi:hypothetical protein
VYRGLVKDFQKLKGRQSVCATHNADILASGYADQVVLNSLKNGRICTGFTDDHGSKQRVMKIMKGEEVFKEGGEVLWIY